MEDKRPDDREPLLEGMEGLPGHVFEPCEPRASFRDELLGRTTAVVRWRARRRIAVRVAAIVMVYVVGAVSGSVWTRSISDKPAISPSGQVDPALGTGAWVREDGRLPVDPGELERSLTGASAAEQSALLRRAGDAYISGSSPDPEAAVHCYGRLLARLSPAEQKRPKADDNWLLLYMKLAQD